MTIYSQKNLKSKFDVQIKIPFNYGQNLYKLKFIHLFTRSSEKNDKFKYYFGHFISLRV